MYAIVLKYPRVSVRLGVTEGKVPDVDLSAGKRFTDQVSSPLVEFFNIDDRIGAYTPDEWDCFRPLEERHSRNSDRSGWSQDGADAQSVVLHDASQGRRQWCEGAIVCKHKVVPYQNAIGSRST
jgi:hypothetical protein